MPPITPENAPSSDLEDVLAAVRDLLGAAKDPVTILIGAERRDNFVRSQARTILFVPEQRGSIGPPLEMGNAGSIRHGCDVYVRAPAGGADATRFKAATALTRKMLSTLRRAGTGRLDIREHEDDSPIKADAFGADLHMAFTYTHDVEHDAEVWAVPGAAPDTSPPRPLVPPGIPATEPTSFTPTTSPLS